MFLAIVVLDSSGNNSDLLADTHTTSMICAAFTTLFSVILVVLGIVAPNRRKFPDNLMTQLFLAQVVYSITQILCEEGTQSKNTWSSTLKLVVYLITYYFRMQV